MGPSPNELEKRARGGVCHVGILWGILNGRDGVLKTHHVTRLSDNFNRSMLLESCSPTQEFCVNFLPVGLPDHGWCLREVCPGKSNHAPPHLDDRKGLYDRVCSLCHCRLACRPNRISPPPSVLTPLITSTSKCAGLGRW